MSHTAKKKVLTDMKRAGLTKRMVDNALKMLYPLQETTGAMCDNAEDDGDPETLYEDLCGEICNVINNLEQLKEAYS